MDAYWIGVTAHVLAVLAAGWCGYNIGRLLETKKQIQWLDDVGIPAAKEMQDALHDEQRANRELRERLAQWEN